MWSARVRLVLKNKIFCFEENNTHTHTHTHTTHQNWKAYTDSIGLSNAPRVIALLAIEKKGLCHCTQRLCLVFHVHLKRKKRKENNKMNKKCTYAHSFNFIELGNHLLHQSSIVDHHAFLAQERDAHQVAVAFSPYHQQLLEKNWGKKKVRLTRNEKRIKKGVINTKRERERERERETERDRERQRGRQRRRRKSEQNRPRFFSLLFQA